MSTAAGCSIEGCGKPTGQSGTARGLCSGHYHRWLRYGNATASLRRLQSYHGMRCIHDECSEKAESRGLCNTHYTALRRKQNPEAQKQRTARHRERQRVEQDAAMGRPRPDRCELCDEPTAVVFDHDHATGAARGWLCDRCNRTLGQVKDSKELLAKMISYLQGCKK